MINFATLFQNLFEGSSFAGDKFKSFTEDHIHRLAAGNENGIFSLILATTSELYNTFFGGLSDKMLHAAVQKSLTNANNEVMEEFFAYIRQHEGLLRSKFKVGSGPYMEFLPLGLTELNGVNKSNIEKTINRIKAAAEKYKTTIGTELVTDISAFEANYKSSRDAQLGKITELDSTEQGTKEARQKLELQILINIYTIGLAFPGDVEKCTSYFKQSIIRPQTDSNKDGIGNITGLITSGGVPLVNVLVEIIDRNVANSTTDTEGKYRTRNADIGMAKIRFSKEGYITVEKEIEIVDAGDTVLNIEMVKI